MTTTKPYTVKILWGSAPEPDDEPITYEFATQAELDAFMEGAEAACGWLEMEVVTDDGHDIDWEAVARIEGWEVVVADPHPLKPGPIPEGPLLYHRDQDRIWPLDDWEGAARDLGIDDEEAREILARAA